MNSKKSVRLSLVCLFAGTLLLGSGCWMPSASPPVREDQGSTVPASGASAKDVLERAKQFNDINMTTDEQASQERPTVPTEPVGVLSAERIENKIVRISTGKGEIVFELYAADAPKAVSNFVALAESGFYDGLTFHRVVPEFVIQGGDPMGNGRGGPGYTFEDEPVTRDYRAGTVAMANAGPNTNGSQFFICLDDQPALPKAYTIFGQVISGQEVVRSIVVGDKMDRVAVENKQ